MAPAYPKKSPAKERRTPARTRRSTSKSIKGDETPQSQVSRGSSKKSTPRDTSYSHRLPTDYQRRGNGRVSGRSLIMWNRPRMAEKLLLHIHYECFRHKVSVPWDAIAHRLHPGSSGAAVLQHFNRVRRDLVAKGHVVPPLPNKPGSGVSLNPEVRGYVRMHPDGPDKTTTRPVLYDENVDDARFNLPDAFAEDDEDEEEDGDLDFPDSPTLMRGSSRSRMRAQRGSYRAIKRDEEDAGINQDIRAPYFNGHGTPTQDDSHLDMKNWGSASFSEGFNHGHVFGSPGNYETHGYSPFVSPSAGHTPRSIPRQHMMHSPGGRPSFMMMNMHHGVSPYGPGRANDADVKVALKTEHEDDSMTESFATDSQTTRGVDPAAEMEPSGLPIDEVLEQ